MGFSIKFNWALKTAVPAPLETGTVYSFQKSGNRVYPLNIPIDLIDADRNAVAKIRIKSFTNEENLTRGSFEVVKIYAGEEQQTLTRYWIENA